MRSLFAAALLCSLPALAQAPSVGLILREDSLSPDGGVERLTDFHDAFVAAFTKAGWRTVTPPSESLTLQDAAKLDFVLLGSVGSRRPGRGEVVIELNLQLMYGGGTREVLWSDAATKKAKGKSWEEAYRALARDAAAQVSSLVGGAANQDEAKETAGGRALVITLRGVADFGALQKFKKALTTLPGVTEVAAGSLKTGEAKFDVTYDGTAEQLAKAFGTDAWKGPLVSAKVKDDRALELTAK